VRPIRLLAAVPAAVLLVAGCGNETTPGSGTPAGSSSATGASPSASGITALSADQILAKATAALQSAGSVRIKGNGGKGTEKFTIDLRYSGQNTDGKLGVSGQTIELRKLGRTVYLKASRAFWRSNGGEAAAQLLSGKWLKTPLGDKRFSGLSELTDLRKAAKGVLEPDGKITKGTEKTVNGQPAISLLSKGADAGVLWVATTGDPRPVRIEPDPASGETGGLDFTGYGESVTVQAPPADLVVDVNKLGGN
jgi:hypothetical protein